MPRFFFHLTDGENTLPDREGQNLASTAEARRVVVAQGGQVISSLNPVILVTDEKGQHVYAAAFSDGDAGSEAKRQAQFELLSRTEQMARVGGWELDLSTKTLSWTPGVFRILKLPYGPVPSFTTAISLLTEHSQRKFSEKIFGLAAREKGFDFEVTIKASGDRIRLSGIWAHLPTGIRAYGIVSEEPPHEKKNFVWELANHDALTGLPNRGLFEKRLAEVLAQADHERTKIALVIIDLDHLKETNDAFGHSAGDAVLRAVGERLRSSVRPNDLNARLGGDEFCVALTGLSDSQDITALVESIHERLHRPVNKGADVLSCGASIGIAIYPDHGESIESLQANADIALSTAKSIGRGSLCLFSPEMRKRLERRLRGVANARAAADQGQTVPFYQPQICLKTGKIVGFEALLRWNHPTRGVLPPSEIEDAFEDRELAAALGENLLNDVLDDIVNWRELAVKFGRIAFNASRMELIRPRYAQDLLHKVELAGLEPGVLELEVHENALAGRGSERVEATIRELANAGLFIALDDFGTGFGSLTHLRRLPVSVVKIDKSFVQAMKDDNFSKAIINGLIKIASEMNIRVVAEGVESTSQASYLKAQHCEVAQGYYFAGAMAADEVADFVKNWAPKRLPEYS